MKIAVTQEHIDKGHAQDPLYCPIALALAEAGYPGSRVRAWTVMVNDVILSLPEVAGLFIHKFDTGKEVVPIEFNLYP